VDEEPEIAVAVTPDLEQAAVPETDTSGSQLDLQGMQIDSRQERRQRLLCVRIALPKGKDVILGILANGEVAHLRHGCFRFVNFAA